jgi:hypothetical protein
MTETTTAGSRHPGPTPVIEHRTIRPFQVRVPEEELVDLRRRLAATRRPEETVADQWQGVQLAAIDERRAYERLRFLYTKDIGYATEMALRPQMLYGLADSPVAALAAWMLDHSSTSTKSTGATTSRPGRSRTS